MTTTNPRRAIILDRDGTINKDRGYIGDPARVSFYDIDYSLMRQLGAQYLFFVATNQAGIGKGLTTRAQVDAVNRHISQHLAAKGVKIMEFLVCPHRKEDNCSCRKPKQILINRIVKKYGIERKGSFMLGDHVSDIEFAARGGVQGLFLLTGHGRQHLKEIGRFHAPHFRHINEALTYISNSTRSLNRTVCSTKHPPYQGKSGGSSFTIIWHTRNGRAIIREIIFASNLKRIDDRISKRYPATVKSNNPRIAQIVKKICACLNGEPAEFSLEDLELERCTAFQRRVLKATFKIKRSEVTTYSDIARAIGSPKATRAVGTALARNPFPIIVPCHRVIGADGKIGGYQCGSEMKRKLLHIEELNLYPPLLRGDRGGGA